MASNKRISIGPIGLTTTLTTNIFNPGTTTGGVNCTASPNDKLYAIINHLRVTNTTSGAITITLYKGATGANAAGTELMKGVSIPANTVIDYYPGWRFNTVDFLVGGSGSGSSNDMNIEMDGELGVA